MAGVFSQDNLEMYFSKQRAACGGNRNPNEDKYLRNVASLHLQRNLKMQLSKGNVSELSSTSEDGIIDIEPLPKRQKTAKRQLIPIEEEPSASDDMFDPLDFLEPLTE